MKTSQEEAPFGGTELFTSKFIELCCSYYLTLNEIQMITYLSILIDIEVEGRAVAYVPLASHCDCMKIGEELKNLGESMNCDVEFQDVTVSTKK